MSIEIINIDNKKSLLSRRWKLCDFDERNVIYLSQKYNLKYIVAKLLSIRGVDKDYIENFLNPNICLLYTSDAADDTPCVDLGGRRII